MTLLVRAPLIGTFAEDESQTSGRKRCLAEDSSPIGSCCGCARLSCAERLVTGLPHKPGDSFVECAARDQAKCYGDDERVPTANAAVVSPVSSTVAPAALRTSS